MRIRRLLIGLTAPVALGLVAACTASTSPPTTAATTPGTTQTAILNWRAVTLPGGMTPSTLLRSGGTLWAGGFTGAGQDRKPALARTSVTGDGIGFVAVPPTAASPYGQLADIFSLAASGDQLIALGVAHGGAHANPRWSTWALQRDPAQLLGLAEQPQLFWTFGGEEAGGLLGAGWDSHGPLIVGTWQGKRGLDGALWRRTGAIWAQTAPPAALVNTATLQVSPVRVDQVSESSVAVSGSVIDLTDGVRQEAATWRDTAGQWQRTILTDPGKRSQAWATACESDCASVGFRDGAVVVWVGSQSPHRFDLAATDADSGVVMRSSGTTIAAVSANGKGAVRVGSGASWRALNAPDGTPRSLVEVARTLYLVTGSGDSAKLYMAPADPVLPATG